MKIHLNQSEVIDAITEYVSKAIPTENKSVLVTITAGRKGNGTTASIDIGESEVEEEVEVPTLTAVEDTDESIFNQA
jgi:hypothetical protein